MTTTLDRRLTPARPDLADARLRGIVEAGRYVEGRPQQVVAPSAPVRREPRPDAPLDTEALLGESVTVFDEFEGFAWAQLAGDGYVGYLPTEALGPAAPPPTHRVSALRTFLYPGPDLKLPALGHVSLGVGLTPVESRGEYLKVTAGGWVFAGHVAPVTDRAADYVAVAECLMGAPYLWGGKTSLGLDCSGLVQLSLAMAGIAAPRDTDMQQAAVGREVPIAPDLAGLMRGDLVFWRGHVGIMLDGTRLLHANAHHMAVAIEPLREAEGRIREKTSDPITAIRRLG
jgi:cell wall-associated NlpC family hydrolase